jgi:chemotaxis protein CheX
VHRSLTESGVAGVVSEIWTSILGLDVAVAGPAERAHGGRSLTGVVHMRGDNEGTVSLECPRGLAARATAVMFGVDERDVTPAEIQDAMGELTNMTAGGVKALVPGTSQLSLPTVVEGREYRFNVPGAVPIRSVWFECHGHRVVVRVFERAGSTARSLQSGS